MPPDTTCSPTSKDTTIVSGSIPPSGISPPNRQSAKPLNPVSTKSQEGHRLSPGLAVHLQLAGKSHERLDAGAALFGDIVPHAEIVFQGRFAAGCDHHSLGLAGHLGHDMAPEVLDDHLDLLADCRRVQMGKAGDLALRLFSLEDGVVFDNLFKLVIGLVGHVVLQDVEDESLLDCLAHGIKVEWVWQAVRPAYAEAFQGHVAWRRGEREGADIGLWPPAFLVLGDEVFHI